MRLLSTLQLLLCAAGQTEKPERETAMRAALLQGYDPAVPGSFPSNVSVGINIFKLTSVDLASSTLEMNAWVRASWSDPRLDWSRLAPDNYSDVTFTTFNAGNLGQNVSKFEVRFGFRFNSLAPIVPVRVRTLENALTMVLGSAWSCTNSQN